MTMVNKADGYMRTYTNKKLYPARIEELEVCIEDIAHHTAQMNRYCGALNYSFNIAQHGLMVEEIFSNNIKLALAMSPKIWNKYRLQALLHDASEAYLPDIPSPWKPFLPDYKVLEKRLQAHIFKHFGLPKTIHKEIDKIDKGIRGSEIKCLTGWKEEWAEDVYEYNIIPMSSHLAEDRFLEKYHELKNKTCLINY